MKAFDWATKTTKRHERGRGMRQIVPFLARAGAARAGCVSGWLRLGLVIFVGFAGKTALADPLLWYKVPAESADTAIATGQTQFPLPEGRGVGAAAPAVVQPSHPVAAVSAPYGELIDDVARRHALDPLLVHAVVATESAYRPAAVSGKGAVGLMQLMPATGARFGKTSLAEPRDNLEAGSAYLSWLVQRFGGRLDLALAGYNAGEGAVARYGNAVPPYAETQAYVRKVMARYAALRGDGAVAVPTVQPAVLRLAAPRPSPTPRRAAGRMGDVGQLWRLFTGGSARADAALAPRI